jgi:hypothetical protein
MYVSKEGQGLKFALPSVIGGYTKRVQDRMSYSFHGVDCWRNCHYVFEKKNIIRIACLAEHPRDSLSGHWLQKNFFIHSKLRMQKKREKRRTNVFFGNHKIVYRASWPDVLKSQERFVLEE